MFHPLLSMEDGGDMPNVVPEQHLFLYYVRSRDEGEQWSAGAGQAVAQGAAIMTQRQSLG
ncbi:MAG: hypothetical protein ACLRZZ_16090 [Enterocloster sp.]